MDATPFRVVRFCYRETETEFSEQGGIQGAQGRYADVRVTGNG